MANDLIFPNFIDGLDLELDFDLSDFKLLGLGGEEEEDGPGEAQARVMRPRLDIASVSGKTHFSNAREFADQIDLSPGARTFAWVDGSFIFGDVIEALVERRHMLPEEIYISSLSISQENIDSLKTLLMIGCVRKLTLVLSAYFYSHEKFDLVPYLYQELDVGDILQVAFINVHTKIIAIKTALGNTLTIHGSANLRSSKSIEQLMAERDPELYEFNAHIMDELAEHFGTINHDIPNKHTYGYTYQKGANTWPVVAAAAEAAAGEEPEPSPGRPGEGPAR